MTAATAAGSNTAQSRKPHMIIIAVRIGYPFGSVMLASEPQPQRELNRRISVGLKQGPL